MDAGLAAVTGAAVGSLATIGASLAAGWFQREGALIASRAEHRRERNGVREVAYRDLITSGGKLVKFLDDLAIPTFSEYSGEPLTRPTIPLATVFDDDFYEELSVLENAVTSAFVEVSLLGPKAVAKCGEEFEASVQQVCMLTGWVSITLMENAPGDADDVLRQIRGGTNDAKKHLAVFTESARDFLDDDGLRKVPSR
ncbi:hypothetical protein ACIREE_42540 [Streptomyces sp. NPDC102467]|uniref:hypothetical protein n=1 Tax=Streptomyces sp. NPDC102467 TaxID=3366179 RepID=UPI0038257C0B